MTSCVCACVRIEKKIGLAHTLNHPFLVTLQRQNLSRYQIMGKSTHFFGQPILGQLLNYLNKGKILQISRDNGGERYVKKFNAWCHLTVMLYAVIMRFDSLREITSATMMECRKLRHLGVEDLPRRSTLSDANARRPEVIFERIHQYIYLLYKEKLSSDSHSGRIPKWMHRLHIIDSTTITLFANLIFRGAGRNPKTGKKKGGIKSHSVIQANEGVPYDVQFTSAATHDHFMLSPDRFAAGDIATFDRACIDIEKFEQMTQRGVFYVTKMKKNLTYETMSSVIHMNEAGQMQWKEEVVVFRKTKRVKDENGEKSTEVIEHHARIITYVDEKKKKLIRLLTNDFAMPYEDIVAIYRKRWAIELLFKQLKQNFPLRYFYGESGNAIKTQIWVTLIANLLLTLLERGAKRSWSFSGLATMVRIMLLYYIDVQGFLEHPEKDWERMVEVMMESPPEQAKN